MITRVPITTIQDNPFQPRERYEDIEGLAAKIAAMKAQLPDTLGLIHPPNARRVDGVVQLAEGHRRLRAFMHLEATDPDYAEMPVNLVTLSDDDMDDIAWSENRDRKDLTPIEEARALKRTLETRGLTQEQLGTLRHLGRSTVANKIRLLSLPDDLLAAVDNGQVTERQAMDLLPALEIKTSDLDGAGLNKNIHFTPGSSWDIPTPNTLKRRVLEFGNLTGDQIRMTVEQIKKEVEKAKLARWQRENPQPAPKAEIAPPPAPPAQAQAPAPKATLPDVCARTIDPDELEEAEEPETGEPDWLQPVQETEDMGITAATPNDPVDPDETESDDAATDDDSEEWNGGPEEIKTMQAATPPPQEAVAPPPPPPPAPKPQPIPAVIWQVTISIKQENGPIKPETGAMLSLFKGTELVESASVTYAQLQPRLANLLGRTLPVEIPF